VERLTVSDARGDQSLARTDGRWVVYEDARRSSPVATGTSAKVVTDQADIRVRNLDTGQERRLTDTSNARRPDVSGDLAVWSELGDDGRWSIVIYDLEDRSVLRRIDRDGNQQFPAISGQRVVWQDSRRGNWDIRAYDIDERREFWVSDSSEVETNPSIDGGLVAFERDGLIWYRDLATNRLERVPDVGGYEPSVSGDRIAFRGGGTRAEPRDASIYVFDRRDGSLIQVSSTLDARRGNPRSLGDVVVWWDRRDGNRDVYAYDLVTKTEFAIATNAGDQDQPDVGAGSPYLMVWTDWRDDEADIRGARVSLPTAPAEPATPPVVPVVPQPIADDPNPIAPRDARYFSPTGFRIDDDQIWEYFQIRGGVKNFGYPTSRTFTFLGFTTQFFQRHIVQVGPEGPRLMNLLDPELMPYTTINTSTFPAYDPNLASQAPPVGSPNYDRAIIDFIRQYAADEYAGQPVRFFQTFASQVDLATAFPGGGGNADLLPGINLELAGAVTSPPVSDPNNPSFVYQRFQRVILHYDAASGSTQPILLADYFKAILTGETLPPDLAEQASSSRFFMQYNPAVPLGLNRPGQLPGTDMLFAFERH
jgi:beta propeller repeat protein